MTLHIWGRTFFGRSFLNSLGLLKLNLGKGLGILYRWGSTFLLNILLGDLAFLLLLILLFHLRALLILLVRLIFRSPLFLLVFVFLCLFLLFSFLISYLKIYRDNFLLFIEASCRIIEQVFIFVNKNLFYLEYEFNFTLNHIYGKKSSFMVLFK